VLYFHSLRLGVEGHFLVEVGPTKARADSRREAEGHQETHREGGDEVAGRWHPILRSLGAPNMRPVGSSSLVECIGPVRRAQESSLQVVIMMIGSS
jgi:hypothetical protein